jgi:4,5-DOPA dioxygenase extradiol
VSPIHAVDATFRRRALCLQTCRPRLQRTPMVSRRICPYRIVMNTSLRQPVLFVSHGAPTLALQENAATRAWRGIGAGLDRPRAVIVASAHHDTPGPALTGHARPETIHDFHGFPRELYDVRYPAAGAPDIAAQVRDALAAAGFAAQIDTQRGIDHGVWVPLLRLFPQADVPVISLSVDPRRDARWQYRLGQTLAPLREQGVLIVGSGSLTHNLRALDWRAATSAGTPQARAFADWTQDHLAAGRGDALLDWERAPESRFNHPTPEHWLPFPIALGAAADSASPEVHAAEFEFGALAQHAFLWG